MHIFGNFPTSTTLLQYAIEIYWRLHQTPSTNDNSDISIRKIVNPWIRRSMQLPMEDSKLLIVSLSPITSFISEKSCINGHHTILNSVDWRVLLLYPLTKNYLEYVEKTLLVGLLQPGCWCTCHWLTVLVWGFIRVL